MNSQEAFRPDWISSPGETIADVLMERNISPTEFARRIGESSEVVQALLSGRAEITDQIAAKLHSTVGGSPKFWKVREANYRIGLQELYEAGNKALDSEWLEELPTKDMVKLGWIPGVGTLADRAVACLQFFGVREVSAWRREYATVLQSSVFRTSPSFDSAPGAVAAWIRRGEIESAEIECKPWDAVGFKNALVSVRALTREPDPSVFIPELRKLFADFGVAVVVLRAPSGCRASGVTRFVTEGKALMLLSFRHLSDDQFWFSVFHEAGHLVLHGKATTFLDGPGVVTSKEEKEANEFAASLLIPAGFKSEMMKLPVDGRAVMRFARKIGIAPGIVVGQLQHIGHFERMQLNNLKRRYKWTT